MGNIKKEELRDVNYLLDDQPLDTQIKSGELEQAHRLLTY